MKLLIVNETYTGSDSVFSCTGGLGLDRSNNNYNHNIK